MTTTDLEIIEVDDSGLYDISVASNGDLSTTEGFDTSILRSIFGERRADPSEQSNVRQRRGWIGNLFNEEPDHEDGSKFWLKFQARRTQDTINLVATYIRNAFQWMIDDQHVDDVQVSTSLIANGIQVDLEFIRNGSLVESRSFQIWENTLNSFD